MPLGFSAVPPELKPITAFVQRADELKSTEPIVAYWCTYHAVRVGIGMAQKTAAAREFLSELLGTLENMKANISKDADSKEVIDSEAASAAYVEGFALRVFTMADEEDRAGNATRGTAKKFLAAANFLDALKVFDQPELVEPHQDKVRYAKWKAADIAKAFREGRKPLPGPAGGEAPELPSLVGLVAPGEIQAVTSADIPHVDTGDIERANLGFLGISSPPTAHEATSPGEWSTAATPGVDTPTPGVENNIFGAIGEGRGGPVPRDEPHQDERSNEVIDEFGTGVRHPAAEAPLGRAESSASIVDGDVAATDLPKANGNADALDIEPTPSPAPILSPSAARRSPKSPPKNVSFAPTPASPSRNPPPPPPPPSEDMVATRTPVQRAGALPPIGIVPPPGAIISNHTLDGNPAVPPPPVLYVSAPPPALPQVDLTPQLIAKIQRNCRFAISALDYEDAETARKELRAALASLGG